MLNSVRIEPENDADSAIIWLHGLGANGHDFESLVPELELKQQTSVRFIFPHAPSIPVTINGGMVMPAWYDILDLSASGRNINDSQLLHSASQVTELIDEQINAGIDSRRIVLAGFSQGGAVIFHAGLTCQKPLAGLLALSTYFPTANQLTCHKANNNIPIAVMHGTQDPVIPLSLAEDAVDSLKQHHLNPQMTTYPMEHSLCLPQITDISAWIEQVLA